MDSLTAWFDVYRFLIGKDYKGLKRYLLGVVDSDKVLKAACKELAQDQLSVAYLEGHDKEVQEKTALILDQTRARMKEAV